MRTALLLVPMLGLATPVLAEGQHGAAAMDVQLKAVDGMGLGADQTPKGVDWTFWKHLVPADNQMTPARIALGKKLYFDTKLSADGTVSCATCHDVTRSFTDRRGTSEGIKDQLGRRNAPTTMNAAFLGSQFWDGRAATLEEQAGLPILNPVEMGHKDEASAMAAIAPDTEYAKLFQDAYGKAPNYPDLRRAIAAFERTLIFLDSPFDRFMAGDKAAISASAKAGWELFNGKARCTACHPINGTNPVGSDHRFHNIGVSARVQNFEALAKQALTALGEGNNPAVLDRLALETDMSELGRFIVTKRRADIGSFRTSQIRNIGVTAPYMHDGTLQTLWDVVDHYNKGGEANPYLDGGIEPLALSETEIDQLVAFLFSLTDSRLSAINDQEQAAQSARAKTTRPFRDDALANRQTLPFESRVLGKP